MFGKNFNAESSIKKWASIVRILSFVYAGLCALGSFITGIIVLFVNNEPDFLWLPFVILVSGALAVILALFTSTLIWGFGDLIGNTKRPVNDTEAKAE